MKASLWARCTHYRAMHDKTSIPTARWHVYEANHGKSKFIACMDQLQQPWQNWITRKQSARNIFSKSRARLRHGRGLHNCKQGHGWIEHNYIYKTSLLNILKRSMDLTVDTWIHGNKITAVTDLAKSKVPGNRNITKPSLHACASHHKDHKNTWHTPL